MFIKLRPVFHFSDFSRKMNNLSKKGDTRQWSQENKAALSEHEYIVQSRKQ